MKSNYEKTHAPLQDSVRRYMRKISLSMFLQIQSVSQLGYIFVSFVSERACVISVTFFKCSIAKSDVGFFWLWGDDLCLIDNVTHITISFKWARILDPATTVELYYGGR